MKRPGRVYGRQEVLEADLILMDDRLELTPTLHGLKAFNEDVDGDVFVRKLGAFLRGIKHSDMAANGGKRRHKLLLTALSKNTATASVREQLMCPGPSPHSGMAYFGKAVDAVYTGRPEARDMPLVVLRDIADLNRGVGRSFAFGEFKSNRGAIIRIDDYLDKKSRALIIEREGNKDDRVGGFKGIAYGSFDGMLKLVDLRGDVRRAVLILTAGGKEIDCTVNALTLEGLLT